MPRYSSQQEIGKYLNADVSQNTEKTIIKLFQFIIM